MIDQHHVVTGLPSSGLNRDSATPVDIIKLLDRLEQLVEDSMQIFGRAMWVNADEFFVYTNKIRAFLPEDLKRANRMSRDSEKLLEETKDEVRQTMDSVRQEADRYLQDARERAQQMVSQSEVTRQANAEALRVVEAAEKRAAEIRFGADQYAKEVLASLDAFLGRIMGTIDRGRQKLDHKDVRAVKP
ncbi:MAG: hypothetical protein IT209_09750 [Armatimonadetes bacterium]|nr:hypothetical protein [Armatimonadota bacterium]